MKNIPLVAGILFLVAGGFLIYTHSSQEGVESQTSQSSVQAFKTYTNEKLNFSFEYPSTWWVNEDTLNRQGTLRIVNYDPNTVGDTERWKKGMNKIEIGIGPNTDFTLDPGTQVASTTVAGLAATKLTNTDSAIVSYDIPYTYGEHMLISIHGDRANFGVLDDVVNSLTWLKK